MGTPRPRRALDEHGADTAAIAALSPAIIPTESDDRAVFVIDGEDGPVAAIDLRQMSDHISVEHLVGGHAREPPAARPRRRRGARDGPRANCAGRASAAAAGASATARCSGPATISTISACRCGTTARPRCRRRSTSAAPGSRSRCSSALAASRPRCSSATMSRSRTSSFPPCCAPPASVFAIYQIGLLTIAARRVGGRLAFAATSAAAAVAIIAIGALLVDRAVPALVEMCDHLHGRRRP